MIALQAAMPAPRLATPAPWPATSAPWLSGSGFWPSASVFSLSGSGFWLSPSAFPGSAVAPSPPVRSPAFSGILPPAAASRRHFPGYCRLPRCAGGIFRVIATSARPKSASAASARLMPGTRRSFKAAFCRIMLPPAPTRQHYPRKCGIAGAAETARSRMSAYACRTRSIAMGGAV
jgi:hypothetical protein